MRGITSEMASFFDDPGCQAVETVIITRSEVDNSQKESIAYPLAEHPNGRSALF
jgi:hypothetical protein